MNELLASKMNKSLTHQLVSKVLEANEREDQFNVRFEMDEGCMMVRIYTQPSFLDYQVGRINLMDYFRYEGKGKMDKDMNYAIAELNYYIKYGVKTVWRIELAKQLIEKCEADGIEYKTTEIADYLEVDEFILKGVLSHEESAPSAK